MEKILRKLLTGSTLFFSLASCAPDSAEKSPVDENTPVHGVYAGRVAMASSGFPKLVRIISKNGVLNINASDDNRDGIFQEKEMWTEITPDEWGTYDPADLREGFEDVGAYLHPDSLKKVYTTILEGGRK